MSKFPSENPDTAPNPTPGPTASPDPGPHSRHDLDQDPQQVREQSAHLADPTPRDVLFSFLDGLGIATTTVEHAAVFTVAQSDQLTRDIPGGHTKNLFLKDAKGRLFLVVAESHASIDMKHFHKRIGSARLSFGKPELLAEILGVLPGSVTALSLINDPGGVVTVIIDQQLLAFETINCHPLINTATTALETDDLLKFIRATGHDPIIMPLNEPSAGAAPPA